MVNNSKLYFGKDTSYKKQRETECRYMPSIEGFFHGEGKTIEDIINSSDVKHELLYLDESDMFTNNNINSMTRSQTAGAVRAQQGVNSGAARINMESTRKDCKTSGHCGGCGRRKHQKTIKKTYK